MIVIVQVLRLVQLDQLPLLGMVVVAAEEAQMRHGSGHKSGLMIRFVATSFLLAELEPALSKEAANRQAERLENASRAREYDQSSGSALVIGARAEPEVPVWITCWHLKRARASSSSSSLRKSSV